MGRHTNCGRFSHSRLYRSRCFATKCSFCVLWHVSRSTRFAHFCVAPKPTLILQRFVEVCIILQIAFLLSLVSRKTKFHLNQLCFAEISQNFVGIPLLFFHILYFLCSISTFCYFQLSDPMFSIFISLFSNRSSSRHCGKFQIIARDQ